MKTTIFNPEVEKSSEETIEGNKVRFLLDNNVELMIENLGYCIRITKWESSGKDLITINPNVSNSIKVL